MRLFRKLFSREPSSPDKAVAAAKAGDFADADLLLRTECSDLAETWHDCAKHALLHGNLQQARAWARGGLNAPVSERTEPLAYERLSELYCVLSAETGEAKDEVYRLFAEQLSGDLYGRRFDEEMKRLGPESPEYVHFCWAYCALQFGDLDTAREHWGHLTPDFWGLLAGHPADAYQSGVLVRAFDGDARRAQDFWRQAAKGQGYWAEQARKRLEG